MERSHLNYEARPSLIDKLWRGNSNGKEYANVCHPHFSIHYGLFNLLSICGQSLACPDSERGNNASWSRNTGPDPDRRHRVIVSRVFSYLVFVPRPVFAVRASAIKFNLMQAQTKEPLHTEPT